VSGAFFAIQSLVGIVDERGGIRRFLVPGGNTDVDGQADRRIAISRALNLSMASRKRSPQRWAFSA
jgi:hypothetical protein